MWVYNIYVLKRRSRIQFHLEQRRALAEKEAERKAARKKGKTMRNCILFPNKLEKLVSKHTQRRNFSYYRRTSISGTKKAQITFPLRHFFPLKVVK
jgi:hypothetical protein